MEKNSRTNSILINKLFIEQTTDIKIQFFRYIIVGGLSAIVNIGALYVFTEYLHIYYIQSNIIGFVLGLITNYTLSRLFVFAKEDEMNKALEFIIYAIIGIIGLLLDSVFIWIFTNEMKIYYMLGKIISTAMVFIWNFFARKMIYIIIRKNKR